MIADINYVDVVVLAVILFFGILGFMRGFIRELLGIIGWVGAIVITIYAVPYLQPHVVPYVGNAFIANVLVGIGVFIVALMTLSYITQSISSRIKKSASGGLDRSFGLIFGGVIGVALMLVAFLLMSSVWKPQKWPDVMKSARSMKMLADGAVRVLEMIPEDVLKKLGYTQDKESLKDPASQKTPLEIMQDLSAPKPEAEKNTLQPPLSPSGYEKNQVEDMNRLFNNMEEKPQ